MQLENGGFALWDREGPEEYWLTAYAMDFLVRASEQGYSVPVNAINKGNERLLRYLQEPGLMTVRYSDDAQASRFAAQAYAALVLARQQKAPLGALREIWSRHDRGAIRLAAAAARHCAENYGRCAARRRRPEAGGCHPAPRMRIVGWAITVAAARQRPETGAAGRE